MRIASGPWVGPRSFFLPLRHLPLAALAAAAAAAVAANLQATPAAAVPTGFFDGVPPLFEPPRKTDLPRPQVQEPGVVAWLEHAVPPTVDPGKADAPAGSYAELVGFGVGAFIATLDAGGLARKFDGIGYRLAGVRAGIADVPRVYVDELPPDMRDLESVTQRKRLFIRTLLPLILRANEEIRGQRQRLLTIAQAERNGQPLDSASRAFVAMLQEQYGCDPETTDLADLLRRVDAIPPSLALAQAAEESGWGTSRFVREGNAVFGQRTFTAGAGLVPLRRDRGASYEVRRFSGIQASVVSYLRNLNTHPFYEKFRAQRAAMRARGRPLDSHRLAAALERYSERGRDYVETIRTIMRVNELEQLDTARLMPLIRDRMMEPQPVRWSF